MAVFHIKDTIEHPAYGTGTIVRVEAITEKISILHTEFSTMTKELNSQWVEAHCVHHPYAPPQKPAFTPGVYTKNEALSREKWEVWVEQNGELTDYAKTGISYVLDNVTPGIHLAMMNPHAMVALGLEEGESFAELEKSAAEYMRKVFHRHPDFGYIDLPDGGMVLTMLDERLWYFVEPKDVTRDEKGIPLGQLIKTRQYLLNCCAALSLYAIVKSVA